MTVKNAVTVMSKKPCYKCVVRIRLLKIMLKTNHAMRLDTQVILMYVRERSLAKMSRSLRQGTILWRFKDF